MNRKVIQLAGKTYVVSLPSIWVKTWGIKKGEELDVSEHGSRLVFSTKKAREIKKATVNLKGLSERVIRWTLSALHKKGYDEIEVLIENNEQMNLISDMLKNLFLGFAIVHQSKDRCVIRALSQDLDEQFDAILRRAFLVTLQMAEQSVDAFGDEKQISALLELEKTNNQLTNFCERILNKRGQENPIANNFLYVIIWNLEKIADDYKYLVQECKKLTKETKEVYQKTNQLLREYYEIFYTFDLQKLNTLAEKAKELDLEMKLKMAKGKDAEILLHLHHIALKLRDFSASMYALHDRQI